MMAAFLFRAEIMLFFNPFHHNTVNISIIYTNLIALFAAAIYNIYNIYSAKERFNGLYDSERSSGKMGNYSTPGAGALRTGQDTGCCSVWDYLGDTQGCDEAQGW
ncbi:hypothetical protein CAFE_09090 [Caprobacter fermentans]|uniref:Uncharacterized protein n=1 Tax=Caproicibacter fermentans TaxID=2576756 RepID=A0A6N8HWN0_9FIRM|nr:hypothetical protein [Caproicibacter fermentans]